MSSLGVSSGVLAFLGAFFGGLAIFGRFPMGPWRFPVPSETAKTRQGAPGCGEMAERRAKRPIFMRLFREKARPFPYLGGREFIRGLDEKGPGTVELARASQAAHHRALRFVAMAERDTSR